jgi:argininosuccinate synthase
MKIVLAYSGGLDTSIILRWLMRHPGKSGSVELQ